MLSGIIATTIDYVVLNLFASVFGFPAVIANTISGSISSVFSYKFNKNIVFHDRIHSRRKTFVLYVAIIGAGVLVIQNGVIHLSEDTWALDLAHWLHPTLQTIKLGGLSDEVVGLNISKVVASLAAAWCWNYYMVRRFVFITKEEARAKKTTS